MNTSDKVIRVLIADDHPVTRKGIRSILQNIPDIEVVAEAIDGIEAKQMVAELCPDILLLDLVMPGLRPSQVEEWVRTNCPETITLVLTAHDRNCYLAKAVEAGVAGFLTKEKAPHKLVEAIRRAAKGEVLITEEQLERARCWHKVVGERWQSLTARERQVLVMISRGWSNRQIAKELSIKEHTVETHVGNILGKLQVASRNEAIAWAWQQGVIEELSSPGRFTISESCVNQPDNNGGFPG